MEYHLYNADAYEFDYNSIAPINLIVTDPPYNKNIQSMADRKKAGENEWDQVDMEKWNSLTKKLFDIAEDGTHFVYFGDYKLIYEFIANTYSGWDLVTIGRWEKNTALFLAQQSLGARYDLYKNQAKQVAIPKRSIGKFKDAIANRTFLTKKGMEWQKYTYGTLQTWESIAFYVKNKSLSTVFDKGLGCYRKNYKEWTIPVFNHKLDKKNEHLTPKPIPLMQDILKFIIPTINGEHFHYRLLDPFMGSGSTIISAGGIEDQYKNCISIESFGIEIREDAFKYARDRIEQEMAKINNVLTLY